MTDIHIPPEANVKIDKDKTYRTRDGREVRIYAVDGAGIHPVHGAIKIDGGWRTAFWNMSGGYDSISTHPYDLVEVKPRIKRKVWVNVFSIYAHAYSTRRDADLDDAGRIACVEVEIDVEEGHGL